MKNSTYTYQEAIEKIATNLNLKRGDRYSQDWEYEVADSNRIKDFIDYYESNELDSVEKKILIKLILESYNDYVGENGCNLSFEKKLAEILKSEYVLYNDIIQSWSCEGEALEDSYYITAFIRKIAEGK